MFKPFRISLYFSALLLVPLAQAQESLTLELGVSKPVLEVQTSQKVYVKVALISPKIANPQKRPPLNLALVLDKSGSMRGDRIVAARNAAHMIIERLHRDDIMALISYDSEVTIISPATKANNTTQLTQRINQLRANGNTALYAGVRQGAEEVQKFLDKRHINRVILLSDGQANVGPSSVAELSKLGQQIGGKGISVTTLGLGDGYNEDLMSQLANYSDGNHAFIAEPNDLVAIFKAEFGDASTVIANDIHISIDCALGVRPLQVLGREAEIKQQSIHIRLNQMTADTEKFVILELEVPAGTVGTQRPLLESKMDYFDLGQQKNQQQQAKLQLSFADKEQVDTDVMSAAVGLLANQMTKEAVKLRDKGQVEAAKGLLKDTSSYLDSAAKAYNAPELKQQSEEAEQDAEKMENGDWNRQRKDLRGRQYKRDKQQKY